MKKTRFTVVALALLLAMALTGLTACNNAVPTASPTAAPSAAESVTCQRNSDTRCYRGCNCYTGSRF